MEGSSRALNQNSYSGEITNIQWQVPRPLLAERGKQRGRNRDREKETVEGSDR